MPIWGRHHDRSAAAAVARCSSQDGEAASPPLLPNSIHEQPLTGTQRVLWRVPQMLHAPGMFAINDATVLAVHHAFDEYGKLAAA